MGKYIPKHQYLRNTGLSGWFSFGVSCNTFAEAVDELRKPVDQRHYPRDIAYTKTGTQPIFTGNAVYKNGRQVSE